MAGKMNEGIFNVSRLPSHTRNHSGTLICACSSASPGGGGGAALWCRV